MGENEFNKKLPISAVMVIYNEEKVLERALRSFYDVVDEIIIVHDGKCADKSLEIARKYTDKIFELEHIGEAERHRPFTYQKAKNDWILQVDADEYLSEDLRNNLKNLISKEVGIYDVLSTAYYRGKHYYDIFYKRMLFKKSSIYFIGVTHEAAKPLDKNAKTEKTEFALMHEHPYDNLSFQIFQKKWKAWAKLQAAQLLEDFSTIPKWNCNLNDWEPNRRIRINCPILFGIIATSIYGIFTSIKLFLKHRKYFILKLGFFSFMYNIYL